jgi:uncharacterized iron-regulated membrane protein
MLRREQRIKRGGRVMCKLPTFVEYSLYVGLVATIFMFVLFLFAGTFAILKDVCNSIVYQISLARYESQRRKEERRK